MNSSPLSSSGSKHEDKVIVIRPDTIITRLSWQRISLSLATLVGSVFVILLGAGFVGSFEMNVGVIILGIAIPVIDFFSRRSKTRIRIDLSSGEILRNERCLYSAQTDTKQLTVDDLEGLQILSKHIRGSDAGDTGFICYELNLVFKTGDRLNLLSHGEKKKIDHAFQEMTIALRLV